MENRCIITDIWFRSVKISFEWVKSINHAVLMVKTAHSRDIFTDLNQISVMIHLFSINYLFCEKFSWSLAFSFPLMVHSVLLPIFWWKNISLHPNPASCISNHRRQPEYPSTIFFRGSKRLRHPGNLWYIWNPPCYCSDEKIT